MAVLNYDCSHCGSRHRVERMEPTVVVRAWFCPACGRPCKVVQNHDENYWYAMAEAYFPGLTPTKKRVRLLKEIYETWDANEYHTFRDYFEALKKGAKELIA